MQSRKRKLLGPAIGVAGALFIGCTDPGGNPDLKYQPSQEEAEKIYAAQLRASGQEDQESIEQRRRQREERQKRQREGR